jgi:Cu-Zn family superoxide dismutase
MQSLGDVHFTQLEGRLRIEGSLGGLAPGKHGFHIHEIGDCGDEAKMAGEHFNPDGMKHGRAMDPQSHAGDLGNIEADAAGHARLLLEDPRLSLSGSAGVLGRSLVLHALEDDLQSQPSGKSGARVGCGVIELEAP